MPLIIRRKTMKNIFCCLIFLLTLLNATFRFCEADESSLKLVISQVPGENKSSIIEVKIKNISEQYVNFFNDMIFFEDNSKFLVLPLSELRFYVDKGNGFERLIYPSGAHYPYFNRADPRRFISLAPQCLWGFEVDLESKFKFEFPKGHYSIKAVFENRSRSWMSKYVTDFFSKEEISDMPAEEHVFDGVIESNYLNIEIGK